MCQKVKTIQMAPRRRQCRTGTVMKETSTQTDTSPTTKILAECLQPAVILHPIDLQKYVDNVKKNNKADLSKSSSEEERHSVKPTENSSKALNVPNNYSVFARPINNKENASSTLLNQKDDLLRKQESSFNSKITSKTQKRVKFVKPGPLSYKRKFFDDDDLSVPIMLDHEQNESPRKNLETIFERNTENTPSVDISDSSSQEVMKEMGVQTLVESCQAMLDENNDLGDILSGTPVDRSSPVNKEPENIRLQFGGVTTIISAKSTENSDENSSRSDNSDDASAKDNRENFRTPKYIKIKATTVHIHNHFYKT